MATQWLTTGPGTGGQTFVLSNSNRSVQMTVSGGASGGARSNDAKQYAGQKWYGEIFCDIKSGAGAYGICDPSFVLGAGNLQEAHGAYINSSGNVIVNNVQVNTGAAGALAPSTLRIALDKANNKLWFAQDSSFGAPYNNWNLNNATNDPATNLGGYSIAAWAPASLMLMCMMGNTNDKFTLQGSAAGFGFAIPAGFTAWDQVDNPLIAARSFATVLN